VLPSCAPARCWPSRPPAARPRALLALLPPATDAAFVNLDRFTRETRANGGALLEWLGLAQNLGHSFNDVNTDIVLAAQGWRCASATLRFLDPLPSIVSVSASSSRSSKVRANVRASLAPWCSRATRC